MQKCWSKWHVLTILHPMLMCRVTYWALVELLCFYTGRCSGKVLILGVGLSYWSKHHFKVQTSMSLNMKIMFPSSSPKNLHFTFAWMLYYLHKFCFFRVLLLTRSVLSVNMESTACLLLVFSTLLRITSQHIILVWCVVLAQLNEYWNQTWSGIQILLKIKN